MVFCKCNSNATKEDNLKVNRIEIEASRLSKDERKYYITLFNHHAENDVVHKDKFPELLGLLGTDISEKFAYRIFDIFSSDKDKMELEEDLNYVDVYHHGNERKRCMTTFRLMDVTQDNKVDFEEFENYIELIIKAVRKVHPGLDDVLTSKDTKKLFNKVSNNKEFFNYQEFENVYFKKSMLLSWIDYFKNTDNTFLINVGRNLKILVTLLLRFNKNMAKIFNNIIHLNGNTFNFMNAIKEISKFITSIERIRKHFIHENSSFNIKNFFNKIKKEGDKIAHKPYSIPNDIYTIAEPHKYSSNLNLNYHTSNSDCVKEHLCNLKHLIQDDNYKLADKKYIPLDKVIVDELKEESKSIELSVLNDLNYNKEASIENDYYDNELLEVHTENGLGVKKIKDLKENKLDKNVY